MAQTFSEEIVKELTEMKKLGLRVPAKAFTMAADPEVVEEYDNMKVSDAADLIIQLAGIS